MKYRKKPVVIDAIQWDGKNAEEVFSFTGNKAKFYEWHQYNESGIDKHIIQINTLEGVMSANVGDYIIKGVQGEFYPCKPDIFEATYEVAE
ncbi:hypothetical protein [Acinetobacter sp. UBA2581]|uniref:hypothetical protein n=1 Tax=Acinetobacter sp. UBA2581 TaxID=1945932 RepID=UPI002580CFAF|nr:hypothetical protein [Acinetobacter sp. UBA2581]